MVSPFVDGANHDRAGRGPGPGGRGAAGAQAGRLGALGQLSRLRIFRVIAEAGLSGITPSEIAGQLGISENTSKSQLSRARTYLQKLLTDNDWNTNQQRHDITT